MPVRSRQRNDLEESRRKGTTTASSAIWTNGEASHSRPGPFHNRSPWSCNADMDWDMYLLGEWRLTFMWWRFVIGCLSYKSLHNSTSQALESRRVVMGYHVDWLFVCYHDFNTLKYVVIYVFVVFVCFIFSNSQFLLFLVTNFIFT